MKKITEEIKYGFKQVPIKEMPIKDIRSALIHLKETPKHEIEGVSKPMLHLVLEKELHHRLDAVDRKAYKKVLEVKHTERLVDKMLNTIVDYHCPVRFGIQ